MVNVEYSGNPEAVCYYERLGVSVSATQDEIDTVGKFAKKQEHPDNSTAERETAEIHFHRIKNAVKVLKNQKERKAYDTFIRRFGTDTGTEVYERWVDHDRPAPPDSWAPPSDKTGTNTSSQRRSNEREASADAGSTTGSDTTQTADSESSTNNTSSRGYRNQTTTSETRSSSRQYDAETNSSSRQYGSHTSTGDGANTQSSTATRNQTGYEDSTEEETESRQRKPQATGSDSTVPDSVKNNYTASYVPDSVNNAMNSVMSTPLRIVFETHAPTSKIVRIALATGSLYLLYAVGPSQGLIADLLIVAWFFVFVPFPRIGPWTYGVFSSVWLIYTASEYKSFTYVDYFVLAIIVFATVLSAGYYILVRGSWLDPYT